MIPERAAFGNDQQVDARNAEHYILAASSAAANYTYTMSVYEKVIIAVATDARYTTTVVLPSVAEAKGGIYTIRLVTHGGQDLTVTDKSDDAALTNIVLNTTGDAVCLYSDGHKWFQLAAIGTLA